MAWQRNCLVLNEAQNVLDGGVGRVKLRKIVDSCQGAFCQNVPKSIGSNCVYTGLIGREFPMKIYLILVIGQIICDREAAAFLLSLQCRQVASGNESSTEMACKCVKSCRKKLLTA